MTTGTIAIIGASRGIGLGLLRHYAAAGWRVHATVRGDAPLAADVRGDVQLHDLDVTDGAAIERLADALADVPVDVLVHNAGVNGKNMDRDHVMAINVNAPIQVAEALLPSLQAGQGRKLVLMSSQMGSRQGRTGSLGLYGDSKAALNDAFRARASAWTAAGITAIVLHPGWVRTRMGGEHAALSIDESIAGIAAVIERLTPADSGKFLRWDGDEQPW